MGARATCTHCPYSSLCGFLWRREPSSSSQPHLQYWKNVMRCSWAFSSPGKKDLILLVFTYRAGSPALSISLWLFFGSFPVCLHHSWIEGSRTGHNTQGAAWQTLSGMIMSLSLLVRPLHSFFLPDWNFYFWKECAPDRYEVSGKIATSDERISQPCVVNFHMTQYF